MNIFITAEKINFKIQHQTFKFFIKYQPIPVPPDPVV